MFTAHDLVKLAAFEIARAGGDADLKPAYDRSNDYYLALSAVYPSTLTDRTADFERLFSMSRVEFIRQVQATVAAITDTPPVYQRLRENLHTKSD